MADIENLSIQITASTSQAVGAINRLRDKLTQLNMALANYGSNSEYIKGIVNLANGFEALSNAVSGLDVDKVKAVSKSLGDLATSGKRLSELSFVKTFNQMGVESEKASARIKTSLDDIKKTFGITSKEGIESLSQALHKFYSSANDPAALSKAEEEIKTLITSYMTLNKELTVSSGKIREYMSGSDFAIPINAMKEFGDNYSHMIGVLGIKNQNKDLSKGVGLDVLAEEMNGVFGTNFDSTNALNAMQSIYEALVKDSGAVDDLTDKQRKHEASTVELTQYLDRLYESINRVREASVSVDKDGFLSGEGVDGLDFDMTDLAPVEEKSNEIVNALNDVQQEVRETQELADPFEGIAKGIESLQGISITAEQFAGLKVVASAVKTFATEDVDKVSVSMPRIASALASFSGLHIPDNSEALASLAKGVRGFGSIQATRAQELDKFVEALRKMQYLKFPNVEQVNELSRAIKAFGYVGVEKAIQNMPMVTTAFMDMMTTLSAAPAISQETIQLAQAMAQLATASKSVGTNTQKSSTGLNMLRGAVNSILPSFNKAQKRTFSLAAAFGKLYASYFLLFRAFRKLGEAINYSSKLTEVQNVVAHTFGNATYKVDEFADHAIESFGMAELSAKQFASRFQAMGTTMGITSKQIADANDLIYEKVTGNETAYEDLGDSMADLSINLTKLTADYASFYNLDYEDVADDMASIFTGQTRPMRQYGIDLTNATLKEWALKNGLDANIKTMTQAEKTMLRYQYVMANSGHIMGDFERTMNTWANVIRTIGQQFQKLGRIIGEGLINTFKPMLIRFREFMNTMINITQKALNAVGKLLGWQIEIEEVGVTMNDDMEDYADAIDDAAGNAKKLNAQLRSIDELNNLTTSKGSGSGSDDGLSGGNAEENKVSGGGINFQKYESDIESWFDLGNRIRDKIIDALTNIDWAEIQRKVKENAKNVVNLLNGLLIPDDEGNTIGGKVGEFLAECINTGFDWLVTTSGDKSLWKNAGTNIADFFLKFFETIDFKDMADTIDNIVQGFVLMISTAIDKLKDPENRKKINQKITDFFNHLDPQTIGTLGLIIEAVTITKIAKWAFASGITALLKTALERFLIGHPVDVNISANVENGVVTGIRNASHSPQVGGAASSLGTTIGIAAGAAAIVAISNYDLSTNGAEKRAEFLGQHNVDAGKLNKDDAYAIEQSQLWNSSGTANANLDMWITQTVFGKSFNEKLNNLFGEFFKPGDHSGGGAGHSFGEIGEEIGTELGAGIESGALAEAKSSNAKSKWDEIKEQILTSLKIAFGIHSPATTAYPIGENIILGIFEGFNLVNFSEKMTEWWNKNVAPWFTVEKWSKLGENIKQGLSNKWNEFSSWWSNTALVKWWNEKVKPWFTINKWSEVATNMKQGLANKWEEFALWWNNTALVKWWNEKVKPWFTLEKWKNMFSPIFDAMSGIWDEIKALFNEGFTVKLPHFKWEKDGNEAPDWASKVLETIGLPTKLPKLSVEWYAEGGFPTPGSLFVAGEAGAELLGTMNGRTTVASNGEITGISETIRQTTSEEVAVLRSILNAVQSGATITIDGKAVASSVRKYDTEYFRTKGRSMFAH